MTKNKSEKMKVPGACSETYLLDDFAETDSLLGKDMGIYST